MKRVKRLTPFNTLWNCTPEIPEFRISPGIRNPGIRESFVGGTVAVGSVPLWGRWEAGVRGRPFLGGAVAVGSPWQAFSGWDGGSWEVVGVRGRPFLGMVTGPGDGGSPWQAFSG